MRDITLFVVILLACSPTKASDRGYATSLDGTLWLVDFTTLSSTSIGNTGVVFQGIAQRSDGVLFGASTTGLLYTINTSNATASLIGDTTLSHIEALDFKGSVLIGVEFSQTSPVYAFDQTNALPTFLVSPSLGIGTVRAAATLDFNTLRARGDSLSPTLYDIDLNDGTTSTFKISDSFLNMFGMDFINSRLYGVGDNGKLFSINTVSGNPTIIGDTGNQFYISLTAVVPEPSTSAMLITFCLLTGVCRKPRIPHISFPKTKSIPPAPLAAIPFRAVGNRDDP